MPCAIVPGRLKQAKALDYIEAELLDLRDHPLPFFDEKGPLIWVPSENAEALRWQKTLTRYDGDLLKEKWRARHDSNVWHPPSEGGALSS